MKELVNGKKVNIDEKVINEIEKADKKYDFKVAAVGDDLWHNVALPAGYDGFFKYRRLSNQNILEIYADVFYSGSKKGGISFAIPEAVCPPWTETITGFVGYTTGSTYENKRQLLNVKDDGELYISASSTQIINNFMFNGLVDA